ncbi:unnamed protein product [Linum trigynum]|uniref:Integrase zinc-binding domain-containing protein n=1 Tax=Linum trigynum TaxID=586398 RepID=A0AAV2FYB0_9ROSI
MLISHFDNVSIKFIPRMDNGKANYLAQLASDIREFVSGGRDQIFVQTLSPLIDRMKQVVEVCVIEGDVEDWRAPLVKYLQNPSGDADHTTKFRARNYVLLDETLFKRRPDGLLFKCLGGKETLQAMAEVHEGICGAHQAGPSMRWILHRYGYYWQTIGPDCASFSKGCEACH